MSLTAGQTLSFYEILGVIRFKNVRGEAMDAAVDELLGSMSGR